MCKYVGVVVYQGLIEEISAFDSLMDAARWINDRKHDYGTEDTSDSLIWDVAQQLPVRISTNTAGA